MLAQIQSEAQNSCQTTVEHRTTSQEMMWVALIKNGDGATFNHIVQKYQRPLFNFCYEQTKARSTSLFSGESGYDD